MKTNKGLFIFTGECFREGLSTTRVRDTLYGYISQKECSESHMKLINILKEKYNYDIDIAINTYDTIYKKELLEWYNNHIVYSNFEKECYTDDPNGLPGDQKSCHYSIINAIDNVDIDNYDFLFICRSDILLKDEFFNLFNPFVDKITYSFVQNISDNPGLSPVPFPCVSSVLCIVPRKYYYPFGNWKGIRATSYRILIWCSELDLQKDIGFLTNKIYSAHSLQQKNPLYKINCRPEPEFYTNDNSVYVQERNEIINL